MDYFGLCLDGLNLVGQGVMHIAFVSRFTGKRKGVRCFFAYFLLLCILEYSFRKLSFSGVAAMGSQLLVLYGISRFAMGNLPSSSCAASILALYTSWLSFGLVNSAEAVVLPNWIGEPFLYLLLFLATLSAFGVCACCYGVVLKLLPLEQMGDMPYIGLLLLPGLFFTAAELYILHTSYSTASLTITWPQASKHAILLLLQALGLGALLCTLYAYRRICQGFQAQASLDSLAQAAEAQKIYIAEAQMRYGQTKAFRHDIKNHLSVLSGLLNGGKWEEGKAYLQKLEKASDCLSLPCETGNPVVDILLGEKLGRAKAEGIGAEVSLCLPNPCGVDDFDLCVIFANALDNAIHACQSGNGEKSIRIMGEQQGDFYRLTFENTCPAGPLPPMGTGLSNIRAVAEKYHGAMLTEKTGHFFSLHILVHRCKGL